MLLFYRYLDNFRDPKEIAKDVLLERLASVHPYQYKDTFKPNKIPPNIYKISPDTPDWLKANIRKRRDKTGIFRGLRPSSAIQPLNNNADLDKPKFPLFNTDKHPLNLPIYYPDGHRRPKPLKDTLWVKPPNEHPTFRLELQHHLSKPEKQKLDIQEDD